MKMALFLQWIVVAFVLTALASCERNDTVFYEDDDAESLSVFSDMGNNVMSCYINGKPFRTRDRILRGARLYPEIGLFKDVSAPDADTLTIHWQSDELSPNFYSVSVVLAVKKDFFYNDFTAFNNTRLTVDGVNGYFMINHNRSEKGTGSIYFLRAILMPGNAAGINNQLSGVFEATFPSFKITRCRFDHTLPIGAEGVVSF